LANLFGNNPDRLDNEQFAELLTAPGLKIERIVSIGHATPEGEWLVQKHGEWVLVVQGEAMLRLDGTPEPFHLRQGDHINIPAGLHHRVEQTSANPPTIWLAVHYCRRLT
jgi:cupin 2 domain-containing protein